MNIFNTQLRIPRHKTFVSYHHVDQYYKDLFEQNFSEALDGFISKSVKDGDINPYLPTDRIRQIIRDDFIRDATVSVVLIGNETWKRKYVDWEIGSSIRNTSSNPRTGLIGILLPNYRSNFNGISYSDIRMTEGGEKYNPRTIPPRLHDNIECGFAKIYSWSNYQDDILKWINEAFKKRNRDIPDNSYPSFGQNRSESQTHWS
jgi:hypothetical protein